MNPHIFKAYDVRGLYPSELDEQIFHQIGRAFVGSTAPALRGEKFTEVYDGTLGPSVSAGCASTASSSTSSTRSIPTPRRVFASNSDPPPGARASAPPRPPQSIH